MDAPMIAPMSVGDMFDRLLKLIGKTFTRNLIILLILLVPGSLLMAYGIQSFFAIMPEIIKTAESSQSPENVSLLLSMLSRIGLMFLGELIFLIGGLLAYVGVLSTGCAEMENQAFSWEDALRRAFSVRSLRLVGATIVMGLAVVGVFLVPIVVILLGTALEENILNGVGALLLLVAFGVTFYLIFRWYVVSPAIVWEDAGVLQALSRSASLVKGHWWRTFGVVLLMMLVTQLAISLITTPISFVAMWGFISQYFQLIGDMAAQNASPDPEQILKLFGSLGWGMGMMIVVSSILSMLITPLITVVVYYDLRARNGEFPAPAQTDSEGAAPQPV